MQSWNVYFFSKILREIFPSAQAEWAMTSQRNRTTPEATAQAETHVLRNKKATVVLAFKCQHAYAQGFIFQMNVCPPF